MATCADAAGATYPQTFAGNEILPMEGRSLLPALHGERPQPRMLFWEHEGNRAVRTASGSSWRSGGLWELYDFEIDRTELHNVAERHADVVARLAKPGTSGPYAVGVERKDRKTMRPARGGGESEENGLSSPGPHSSLACSFYADLRPRTFRSL